MPQDEPSSSTEPGPPKRRIRILKFGGTSLADPGRIQAVCDLVGRAARAGPVAVVVSALGGSTDELVAAARGAARGASFDQVLDGIRARHATAIDELAHPDERPPLTDELERLTDELHGLLQGVSLIRECSPRTWDSIVSFGERLSAPIVAAALRAAGSDAEWCDARDLIATDDTFGSAWVDERATAERIQRHFACPQPTQVVTGFIASSAKGDTTTLGRSGSDYTATILAAALDAEEVEIWTDVDGVMSADPRMVPEAFSLEALSYEELMELSHWGARVMHPASVRPARRAGIPLRIRNTLNPAFPGTRVVPDPPRSGAHAVRGIASINDVALLRLEGAGMQGVPGIAQRLFGALARDRISVILITQASSERSICFAIEPGDLERARELLAREFELEREAGLVDELSVEEHCSVLAAVGEGMRETPGISGRVFGVLGHHRINVRAIAQGSSELNISLVVGQEDEQRALRAIHDAFFLDAGSAQLFLAGTGRVGAAFLGQVQAQADALAEGGVEIRLAGVSRSHQAAVRSNGIDLGRWRDELAEGTSSIDGMLDAVLASDHPHRIFVDCTASPHVADRYETLLRDGVAVVTANKLAFSGTEARFRQLQRLGERGMGVYFETTVGAGLPILRTVSDLVLTGDRIRRVEGLLSGTLGFLFHRVGQGVPFSEALHEADERGYTEPDPREDLGGADVARKLVILGRVAGMAMEPGDVQIEPLLPDTPWLAGTVDEFWSGLRSVDDDFEAARARAQASGESLSYLGRIEGGRATVGLTTIPDDHPCAGLDGSDNLVAITTDRYADTPLVVRGPGAGPDVTAAGVFADVLRALAEAS
jgi:aspartokinase/homoserine dehydrogenase 1